MPLTSTCPPAPHGACPWAVWHRYKRMGRLAEAHDEDISGASALALPLPVDSVSSCQSTCLLPAEPHLRYRSPVAVSATCGATQQLSEPPGSGICVYSKRSGQLMTSHKASAESVTRSISPISQRRFPIFAIFSSSFTHFLGSTLAYPNLPGPSPRLGLSSRQLQHCSTFGES